MDDYLVTITPTTTASVATSAVPSDITTPVVANVDPPSPPKLLHIGRKRKAAQEQEPEVTKQPSKRGRKSKATQEEEPEVPKQPAKRGRKPKAV